jgi:hypothetical protein
VAFRHQSEYYINFELNGGEKSNFEESNSMSDYRIPVNFKKVVIGSSSDNRLRGVEFYDKQGTKLL